MIRTLLAYGWTNIAAIIFLGLSLWLPNPLYSADAFCAALAIFGPIGVFLDGVVTPPDTKKQLGIAIASRCAPMAATGLVLTLLPSPQRTTTLFIAMAFWMHFAMCFHANERDPLSEKIRDGVCVLMVVDAVLLYFSAIRPAPEGGYPLVTMAWMMASFAVWKCMIWQTLGVTPLAADQQVPYWTRVLKSKGPELFWPELHRYLREQDKQCSPQTLARIMAVLPMAPIRSYFATPMRVRNSPEFQVTCDRVALAVQQRMMELDPRTIPIWNMCQHDWGLALAFIDALDSAPSRDTWALPGLA